MVNENLHNANKAKNDEFYTQLVDIEKELKHYKGQFKNKVVFCNCDDPRVSNFFFFFYANFHALGLRQLIATCYKNLNPYLCSQNKDEQAVYCIYDGKDRVDDIVYDREKFIKQNKWDILKGDGDFRSKECIELLKQADIVVTNPPFSMFREFVAQLVAYDKKFLIIGNDNCRTYKDIFKFIKENKLWCGYNHVKEFLQPGGIIKKFGNISWYTNLDVKKRHEDLILCKKYNPEEYTKYENYDAINIDKTSDIPMDYVGCMGVPITFIDIFNPKQFEILGLGISNLGIEIGVKPYKEEHKKYRKEVQKRGAVDGDLYMIKNGIVEVPYARIIIKNIKIVK
ncbi:modification methylase EcoRI family protein [Candidatus Symbiothrix dinenymphae]|nr:modification methylase EcoRI family protein [Candidatus Symbiothrix dinenymphae]